jgi:hypothetical protein
LPNSFVIGTDLGDFIFFYGEGNEGFGLYIADEGNLSYDMAKKLSNSLTDFLVKGEGLDIYASYTG